MRTTVDIDDGLLDRAKRLALKEKRTLGAVLGEALAAYLASRKAADEGPPFQLLVRGRAGARFPTAEEMLLVEEQEDREACTMLDARATPLGSSHP